MLKRLARWLRAAGYDTLIQENGGSDRAMLKLARRDGRLLITRDRKLTEFRGAANHVVLLHGNTLEACIEELSQRLALDWLYKPFTRCLICNTVLAEAEAGAWATIPQHSRAHVEKLLVCSTCARLYWEGGHVRRMRARLAEWQSRRGST
jgi:uncharacterized protein with PIN domain